MGRLYITPAPCTRHGSQKYDSILIDLDWGFSPNSAIAVVLNIGLYSLIAFESRNTGGTLL